MGKALIVSAGNNANEYLARHIGELGYTRPTIVASGGEARRRMDTNDYEVIIINTPLPDEFGHELGTDAVQKTYAGVILLAKTGTAEQIADKASNQIARLNTPSGDQVQVTDELVNLKVAEQQAGASAKVVQTASDMMGTLIDIRV